MPVSNNEEERAEQKAAQILTALCNDENCKYENEDIKNIQRRTVAILKGSDSEEIKRRILSLSEKENIEILIVADYILAERDIARTKAEALEKRKRRLAR